MSENDYKPNLRLVNVGKEFRDMFGRVEAMGLALGEDDWRFEIDTPTGGKVTFNEHASARYVYEYMLREGWVCEIPND